MNTVLTILLTIVVLTALYAQIWHKGLNDVVIRHETDTISHPRFPAVAFFQRQDGLQANIYTAELKCSSGPRLDHAVQCSSLTVPEAVKTASCDCGDSWPGLERLNQGANKLMWIGENTSYSAMVPSPTTISRGAGHFIEMQIWFNYNTTEAWELATVTTAPGIWMAIYDPSYDIKQMVTDGQLYTAQIDANSHTVVNIGLVHYRYLNKTANYRYQVSASARQNLDLVCDVTKDGWYLCHLTVEMQIPSLLRMIVQEENRLDWTRVVADAGAYFALIQFFCWIVSGMAWS
ncbi:hypothetical protein HBI53_135100 [Parastagonospora nodorum]|nr:hypothetical protein HBI76_226750 [Parastagonospora nodorum]KAH5008021.1 hypothetical protein HBI74_210820 [Parastagonospora nodorum]KAH6205846.1 hypothetical protein HBI53_135100 [Parastagonospora nodorum]